MADNKKPNPVTPEMSAAALRELAKKMGFNLTRVKPKGMMGGGKAKKMMRGGKAKKMMRGGGVSPRKAMAMGMMGGGKAKKMMRGGKAKNK
jgi:hypothetical protein